MEETNDGLVLLDWQFDKIISAATHSVRYIAKLGQIVMEETSISEVKNTVKDKVVCVKEPEIRKLSFQNLPINIQLLIFSYLDVKTLCRVSPTCKYWCMLAEDDVLWSRLLRSDIHKWKRISNTTYPPTYLEAHSEFTPKEIYSSCYPSSNTTSKSKSKSSVIDRIFYNLQSFKSLFQTRPLNVVMFGPGLESDTKSLIRTLLWDKTSPFTVTGMFPGSEGVGSGICLQLKEGKASLNLITLYASTRAERENIALQNGGRISKLLANRDPENNNDELHEQAEVSHSVKELCRSVDAFIYVVDSSIEAQKVKSGNKELHAMMNVNWTVATVPLLVMSCVATSSTPSESCAEVTELLQMTRLSRPWMVHSVCVESMKGFLDGFMWLAEQANA